MTPADDVMDCSKNSMEKGKSGQNGDEVDDEDSCKKGKEKGKKGQDVMDGKAVNNVTELPLLGKLIYIII